MNIQFQHLPLNLVEQRFNSYLCKPTINLKSKKVEPGFCYFVFIKCDEKEAFTIEEFPSPFKSPPIKNN